MMILTSRLSRLELICQWLSRTIWSRPGCKLLKESWLLHAQIEMMRKKLKNICVDPRGNPSIYSSMAFRILMLFRLGVGAAIPASASALSRDSMRLKHKLAPDNGKKRMRDEDNASAAESDDEDESRGRAITKKVKRDPFGDNSLNKKKKKRRQAEVESVDVSKAPSKLSSSSPSTPSKSRSATGGEDEGVISTFHANDQDTLLDVEHRTTPKKKRKKHKSAENSPLVSATPPSPMHSTSANPSKNGEQIFTRLYTFKISECSRIAVHSHLVTSIPDAPEFLNESGSVPTAQSPINSISSTSMQLLNLDGPPTSVMNGDNSSPKRKRKRRKKKKAHANSST